MFLVSVCGFVVLGFQGTYGLGFGAERSGSGRCLGHNMNF